MKDDTNNRSFLDALDADRLPPVHDGERAGRCLDDLDQQKTDDLAPVLASQKACALLRVLFGNSPYLTRLVFRLPDYFAKVSAQPLAVSFEALLRETERIAEDVSSQAEAMKALRIAKARAALLIAMADIAGLWPARQATRALTDFADAAVGAALAWHLREAAEGGRLKEGAHRRDDIGYSILAMGKYGAGELNYSSDIDLVVLFDPDRLSAAGAADPRKLAIDMTRRMVRTLQELTGDGYVFRVDLRLRPDPGATQVALSFEAAESYYEAMGQNWERAAYIKARVCAGDRQAGTQFLETMRPFIWRKYLDFAAIEDIHSIKRQIRARTGNDAIAAEGHNIKLGRGGIREIEFFVQTQQLILGGRDPDLRICDTTSALARLAEKGFVTPQTAKEMREIYWFLRHVEHRLQMVADEQTHTLPRDPDDVDRIARFCGFTEPLKFRIALVECLSTVERHYGALFEQAPPLSEEAGSLVFTGVEDDPDTINTLYRLGFKRPSEVAALIRGWHRGGMRATRSPRSRERLTLLMPALLRALGSTPDPDLALARFDQFLRGLPAGVQLFALLHAHAELLDLLAQTFGTAPRLAGYLARNPQALDALLDEDFLTRLPDDGERREELDERLSTAEHFEEVLDAVRRFAHEQQFRTGLYVLRQKAGPQAAGESYSGLAECLIRALQPRVEAELAAAHGRVPGGGMAVVALGKLGSREMTAASDLDLIFIYDHPPDAGGSDGRRPLSPNHYYARLAQRFINALTVPTAQGKLYEVDMRLRPSGNAGPIATRLDGFETYHRENAWIWEQMALTRARVISGPENLVRGVETAIRSVLCAQRAPEEIRHAAFDMRGRLAREHPPAGPWDLKYVRGGLVDLEFIAQTLQLVHARDEPGVLNPNTRTAFENLAGHGFLKEEAFRDLADAAGLYHGLTQLLAIALSGAFDPDKASWSLKQRLAQAAGVDEFVWAERRLRQCQETVMAYFNTFVGEEGPPPVP